MTHAAAEPEDGSQNQWLDAALSLLREDLETNLENTEKISYGSDCSGLDAPFWGLRQLLDKFQAGTV